MRPVKVLDPNDCPSVDVRWREGSVKARERQALADEYAESVRPSSFSGGNGGAVVRAAPARPVERVAPDTTARGAVDIAHRDWRNASTREQALANRRKRFAKKRAAARAAEKAAQKEARARKRAELKDIRNGTVATVRVRRNGRVVK